MKRTRNRHGALTGSLKTPFYFRFVKRFTMADLTQDKSSTGNLKYIREILKSVEEDTQKFSADVLGSAEKEYKDLTCYKDITCPSLPIKIIKAENLTTKQLEDSPNLVQVLKYASEKKFANANNAWIEYLILLEKKSVKQGQDKKQEKEQQDKQEDNKQQQQKEEQQQQQLPNDQQQNGTSEESENIVASTSEDDKAMECEVTVNYNPIRNLLKSEAAQNETELLAVAEREYTALLAQRGHQDTEECHTTWQSGVIEDIEEGQKEAAPNLYEIISILSGKTQEHWPTAVTEFIKLTSKLDSPDSVMASSLEVDAQTVCLNIKYLLDQPGQTNEDDRDAAHKDYIRLYTAESYLFNAFPDANIFQYMTCIIHKKEEIQEKLSFGAKCYPHLYKYLERATSTSQSPTLCDQIWNEFAKLLIAEKQVMLAKNAQGPNLDRNILVPRLDYENLQRELEQKYEEVEELSTRLSRFASIQLTEGNPNIADLSDSHRPTKIGEMFSQLYDDEWSEAFEALKPKEDPKSEVNDDEEEEDNFYTDILKQLQEIAMKSYVFCKTLTESQLGYAQKELKNITNLMMVPKTDGPAAPATSNDNAAPDVKPDPEQPVTQTSAESGEEQTKEEKTAPVDPHQQFIDRQAKEYRKVSSTISSNKAVEIFEDQELPKIITSQEMLADSRIKAYSRRCVQLTWYMCVQDPPMKMICLEKGEHITKQQFSFFGRKGKMVEVCLWPALLLHDGGPIVSKGFVLPQE